MAAGIFFRYRMGMNSVCWMPMGLRIVIVLCGLIGKGPFAYAATAPKPQPEASQDDVESVEPLGVVSVEPEDRPNFAATGRFYRAWTLVGHMHPLWIHFPLAWGVLWWAFEWCFACGLIRGELLRWPCLLASLTLGSFVPALVTGLSRLQQVGQEPMAESLGTGHRNLMYLSAVYGALLWLYRAVYRQPSQGSRRFFYPMAVTLWLGILCYGAHLGGVMVYGADFFFSSGN